MPVMKKQILALTLAGSMLHVGSSAQTTPSTQGPGAGQGASGQGQVKPRPMHRVGGARDGASAFPRVDYLQVKPTTPGEIDFAHFHTYDETVSLLRGWAAKYPELVDLYSVGQSFEGREIWQVTIANKKTGKHTDRPAFFIEGGRHAGEISGIEVNHGAAAAPDVRPSGCWVSPFRRRRMSRCRNFPRRRWGPAAELSQFRRARGRW